MHTCLVHLTCTAPVMGLPIEEIIGMRDFMKQSMNELSISV